MTGSITSDYRLRSGSKAPQGNTSTEEAGFSIQNDTTETPAVSGVVSGLAGVTATPGLTDRERELADRLRRMDEQRSREARDARDELMRKEGELNALRTMMASGIPRSSVEASSGRDDDDATVSNTNISSKSWTEPSIRIIS